MLDWHMDDKFQMVNPEQEQSIPKIFDHNLFEIT
jgi:hypothetical protein